MDGQLTRGGSGREGCPVVLLCGLSCSGKSECGRQLQQQHGVRWYEASELLVREIPAGLPVSQRLHQIDQVFEERGKDFIARVLAAQIRTGLNRVLPSGPSNQIVVTGFRMAEEVALFRSTFNAKVISIYASPERRWTWAQARMRVDGPRTYDEFVRLMVWEFSLGLARVMYDSDYLVINDRSLNNLQVRVARLVAGVADDLATAEAV